MLIIFSESVEIVTRSIYFDLTAALTGHKNNSFPLIFLTFLSLRPLLPFLAVIIVSILLFFFIKKLNIFLIFLLCIGFHFSLKHFWL